MSSLVFVGLVVGAAAASAADESVLRGPLDRDGHATIRISTGHYDGTKVRRYRWRFRRISLDCAGRRAVARDPVTGGFAINSRYDRPGKPWGIHGVTAGDPQDPDYAAEVSGRLVSEKKAEGWIRVYGSQVALEEGGSERCDSGRLHWAARG